uniref:Uncharacterized protein n=1 Tax=Neogobius melanostomus TaxID=47308 RepID=A0A8C6UNJ3_9GOBI
SPLSLHRSSTDIVCKCSFRQDEAFRMVFLFQEEYCSSFMEPFSESEPRMQQFLSELEGSAVQLDRMNMGARISSVAGSSVAAVGGVLSIIGLALIPVTAGVSLALTMTGVGLGITSGVNTVNGSPPGGELDLLAGKEAGHTWQAQTCCEGNVGRGIDAIVDAAKLLRSEEVLACAGKVVAEEGQALPRVARGPLALARGARVGFIALNALFLGMDVFFIVNDSMNLARGSETEVSKFIRARSALWRSQMDSWKKIYELLEKGQVSFQKKQDILKTKYYPDIKITRKKEIIWDKETLTETENKEGPTVEVTNQPPQKEEQGCVLQ